MVAVLPAPSEPVFGTQGVRGSATVALSGIGRDLAGPVASKVPARAMLEAWAAGPIARVKGGLALFGRRITWIGAIS